MGKSLEERFTTAMLEIYQTAVRETTYTPSRFINMLHEHGSLGAARLLLHAPGVSEGFVRLYEEKRLDLTVEALILQPHWHALFTEEERDRALRRLNEYRYEPKVRATETVVEEEVDTDFPSLQVIVTELNSRASKYRIGKLQQLRKELKPGSKSSGHAIFDPETKWVSGGQFAFHFGGRDEMQFNVGFEVTDEGRIFRHGLAFSLERSQWVHNPVESLLPRIRRFNEFVRLYPHLLNDFGMWYWENGQRVCVPVGVIPPSVAEDGNFIMLGKRTASTALDFDAILSDLDRLLPLYKFVQGTDTEFPSLENPITGLYFIAGHKPAASHTEITLQERVLDSRLRHNELQTLVYRYLAEEFGAASVGTEQRNGPGNRVDVVVRHGNSYWYYEIKTSLSVRGCIREGISQLLEYSYWPSCDEAERLILVGEYPANNQEAEYLEILRRRFHLPIYYQWFDSGSLRLRDTVSIV